MSLLACTFYFFRWDISYIRHIIDHLPYGNFLMKQKFMIESPQYNQMRHAVRCDNLADYQRCPLSIHMCWSWILETVRNLAIELHIYKERNMARHSGQQRGHIVRPIESADDLDRAFPSHFANRTLILMQPALRDFILLKRLTTLPKTTINLTPGPA